MHAIGVTTGLVTAQVAILYERAGALPRKEVRSTGQEPEEVTVLSSIFNLFFENSKIKNVL